MNIILNIKKIILIVIKKDKKNFPIYLLFVLAGSILPLITIILNRKLVNVLSYSHINDMLNSVFVLLLCIMLVSISAEIIKQIYSYIYTKINLNVHFFLEKKLNEKILHIEYDKFEDQEIYNKISFARQAIERDSLSILNNITTIISSIVTILSVIATLLLISWVLPLVIFLSTIPQLVCVMFIKKYSYNLFLELIEQKRKNSYLSSLFSQKRAMKEFKIFKMEEYVLNKWSTKYHAIQNKELRLLKKEKGIVVISSVIINVVIMLASLFLANMISQNNLKIGDYVALISATSILQGSMITIIDRISNMYEDNKYITSLMEILDKESRLEKSVDSGSLSINSIEIRNLYYMYPHSNDYVLKDITLNISTNDRIAIVGYNGSGKTTLSNILLGLLENYEGTIFVNNHLLDNSIRREYRKRTTCVLQDFMKYSLKLRENIGFGNVKIINMDDIIIEYMENVGLKESYQGKLDYYVDAGYEEGIELSGGEWQKIAIARAMIKNADIIIFDEPTSALDPIAEMKIYELLLELVEDKICIIVSHRLGAIKYCNRIISMDQGEIVEDGTHSELMKKDGLYKRLYTKQASLYQNININ